jgi:hypothetical protein
MTFHWDNDSHDYQPPSLWQTNEQERQVEAEIIARACLESIGQHNRSIGEADSSGATTN